MVRIAALPPFEVFGSDLGVNGLYVKAFLQVTLTHPRSLARVPAFQGTGHVLPPAPLLGSDMLASNHLRFWLPALPWVGATSRQTSA